MTAGRGIRNDIEEQVPIGESQKGAVCCEEEKPVIVSYDSSGVVLCLCAFRLRTGGHVPFDSG